VVRLHGIRLALRPGVELLEPVAGLLGDHSVEVRRAAILAVGPADKAVLDETLLPCLRDPDPEVRRLCEAALRGRGLNDDHLRLSRLLIDPQPAVRLQVLDHLGRTTDLEPGIWLRRLSHDPAPSVRAAAARVMGQQHLLDLTDRLDQMARSDPSPSVSYLAQFYLKNARKVVGEN
jgi:HEAT repeat protein